MRNIISKFFFTLLVLTMGIGQMWGTNTDLITGATLPDVPSSILNMETQEDFTPSSNWIVFNAKDANSKTWFGTNESNSGSVSVTVPSGTKAPFFNLSSKSCYKVRSTARTYAIRFTKATDIAFLVSSGGSRTIYVSLYEYSGTSHTFVETQSESANTATELYFEDLNLSKTYVAYVYESTTSDGYLYEIAVKGAGPGPYSMTYDANGGTGTMTDANSYAKNSEVTTLSNSFTAPSGMNFAGWNTRADGTGTSYAAGASFTAVRDVKLYAQWVYPETGTGTITYALTYDKNEVTPSVSGVSTLSSSSTAFTLSSLTIGVNSDKKAGYSAKIENATADESRNVALQFTVADGYTFTPSDVSMTIFANSTSNMKAKVVLSDGVTTVQSEELSCASSADSDIEFASGAFTDKKFEGNVSVTVYLWLTSGSGKRAYIKSPVTITGTVASAAPPATGDYTVTAVTSTGDNSRGTVSAAASSLDEDGTTSITASPAAGYQVTNWAVTDGEHGATISPSGASNATSTTLTMGTANATVTVTFGLIDYTVEKTLTNCVVKDGSTAIPATMNYGDDLSTIIEPTTGNILPSSISVTGVTSYTWNASTGALTLTDVTGNVSISIEAAAPQTGSGTITYALVTSGETAATYSAGTFTGILSSGTPSLNTLGASNTLTGGNGVGVQSDKNTPKSSRTAGITSSTADFNAASSPYAEFTFSVLDGYTFTPTAISVPVLAISNNAYFTAIVTDGNSTWTSTTAECTQGAQAYINAAPSGGSALTGTVNIRVFCHNQATDAKGFRFGTGSVTITGTVIAAGACTPPTIAWDGDQPSSAFTTDGSKTFVMNSNYAAGIAPELSENTCGATIAVKPETDNKQWVVSFTGAGSVKVTPKVVGDGSTVCAETVSGTAKTLTVTQAYTVTFNMNGHGAAIAPQVVASGSTATAPFVADVDGWVLSGWYKDAECTAGNEFSFSTAITADRPLYAKWIEDPCTDRRSIFKAVLTADDAATVTGENSKEYAGDVLLNKLGGSDGNRNTNATIEGVGSGLTTYKMNGTGAYMYGVLKKGTFQEGDKVSFAVSSTPNTLAIYGAKSSDLSQRVLVITMPAPNAAKVFTYRLTAADATALAEYDAIGIYRASDVTMNPYLYSLEITGCRSWTIMRTVSFDMKGHGSSITDVPVADGEKISAPAEPEADGWLFQGWYKETTLENAWDFANDVVDDDITLYAKWIEDPCTDRQSLSKVVLSKPSDYVATVTGYNSEEYAGSAVIGGLGEAQAAEVDPSHEGNETGYKLASGGNAIVFATLAKGTFQEGDKVVVTITKAQDAYKVEEVPQPILDIYYGTNKDDATLLTTISGVSAAGSYTYRLTAADVTTIGSKTGIGVFRPSSGRTQNPYVYSVEVTGCRSWAIFHTLTFKNADGSATIAAEPLAEGAYASTVAPTAPKVDGYRFIGWSESVGGATVNMATYTITDDAILYAVYEEIICPTSGTLYKFVIKDGLASENLPTSTDKDMSSYIDETGDGALTYTATANNKATINNNGTIQLKDATAAYLKVELACAMAAGDQIRATVSNNPIRVQVGTTYDADKDLILAKDVYNTVDITSAMEGKKVLYIARSTNGNANLADFEVYRRPVLTGVTLSDAIVRVGATGTPSVTLLPAEDAIVTGQAWTIEGEGEGTIADINESTGVVTGIAAGDVTVKVVMNGDPAIYATATVHVVNDYARQDVTGSISWSWDKNGALSETAAQENVNVNETLLANVGTMPNNADFQSDKLVTTCQHAYRPGTGNGCWQGTEIKFYTTVPGAVTVNYMGTSNSDNVTLSINNWTADEYAGGWTDSKTIVVPSGWVTISAAATNTLRIKSITFDAELDPTKTQEEKYYYGGYERTTTQGRFGTICLPNGGVMVGADLFEIAYYGETSQKIFFDQIVNGVMEAGVPYIFLPREGASQLGVFYTDAADASAGSRNGLIGSYTQEIVTPNDGNYILLNNQYCFVNSTAYVGANRAYIKLSNINPTEPALAPGRIRMSMGVVGAPQVATGCENIEASDKPTKVMINGQLFIIRGEKTFDATGRLVK